MTNDRPRRPRDPIAAAEAVFNPAASKPAAAPAPTKPHVPGAKQLVSLRLDEDVIDHFQAMTGPHWVVRFEC